MAQESFKRKLTAIRSADVVGYSRLMGDNEESTIQTLNTYRASMTTLIQQYRGRVVDSTGDNLLAEFISAVDAVNCAVEIQRAMSERNESVSPDNRVEFRFGINIGEIIIEGEDIYGNGVNVAARLEEMSEPGGVYISGTVYEQIENILNLRYEDMGERQVKNMLSSKTPKEVCNWIIDDITNHPRKNFFEVIKSVWNWEAGDKLKRIKVPTLILVGNRDNLTPPRISQLLHAAIPDSKLVIVEDASHYLVMERPELVNAEILKFLKSIGY